MRLQQIAALSKRAVIGTFRQPQLLIPPLLFPLVLAALNTAALGRSTALPGFPKVDSFLDFMVAATVVQGVLFGSVAGATELAIDIEDGFFDRLIASPVARSSILIGRLAGAATLAAVQATIFVGVMMAFGARIKGGVAGFLGLLVVAMILAIAFGGLGSAMALRTGSSEAVQAAFPAFFVTLFMSSAFFPRTVMTGWFKTVATINPLSWLIESVRYLVITGFSVFQLVRALAIVGGVAVVAIVVSLMALRSRIARAA